MAKVHVTAKRDFLNSLSAVTPLSAVEELIWNGFDAQSDFVEVILKENQMNGLQEICIRDNGYGIDYNRINDLFGNLGDSWKKNQRKQNGRYLHGKNGKGRFKAFALGDSVAWNTIFKDKDGKYKRYSIHGNTAFIDDFEVSNISDIEHIKYGTNVVISNLRGNFTSLSNDSAISKLTQIFAAYLTAYPTISLKYNGCVIDPKKAQVLSKDYTIDSLLLRPGDTTHVVVSVVEWKIKTDRSIYLCDKNGISLHEVQVKQQVRYPRQSRGLERQ
jgi:hypothetical protein